MKFGSDYLCISITVFIGVILLTLGIIGATSESCKVPVCKLNESLMCCDISVDDKLSSKDCKSFFVSEKCNEKRCIGFYKCVSILTEEISQNSVYVFNNPKEEEKYNIGRGLYILSIISLIIGASILFIMPMVI